MVLFLDEFLDRTILHLNDVKAFQGLGESLARCIIDTCHLAGIA